jgi:hypothetical protein
VWLEAADLNLAAGWTRRIFQIRTSLKKVILNEAKDL